jgi:large subunit ribosomal protein L6
MSRIANSPVDIPTGVEVSISGRDISIKGSKGSLDLTIHDLVEIKQEDNVLLFSATNNGKKIKCHGRHIPGIG